MSPGPDDGGAWPAAAASRVRVRVVGGSGGPPVLCRLHPSPDGSVGLVECLDGEYDPYPPAAYGEDRSGDGGVDLDGYLSVSSGSPRRPAADSFRPSDAVSVRLSLEYGGGDPDTPTGTESRAVARILVRAYPKDDRGRRTAGHRSYAVDPRCCEDLADVRTVLRAVRRLGGLADPPPGRPPRLLVVLNPHSGGNGPRSPSGARRVYAGTLRPMLEGSGWEHDALVTERGGHARERMGRRGSRDGGDEKAEEEAPPTEGRDPLTTDDGTRDLSDYDGVVALGGDGILYEILQGVRARSDSSSVLSRMTFGVVPCGTFNGLARSLSHWGGDGYGAVESSFRICRGRSSGLDLAEYETPGGPHLSFLSYSWGLIADCDIESEALRFLGPVRSDVWAVYRGLLCRRRYRARFSYLPPGADAAAEGAGGKPAAPGEGGELPEGWRVIEDDLLVFWVCNTSHAAHNMFTCPMAGMDDGLFHVLVVR